MKDVTKTELKKLAKELNEQLGLEPPILLDLKTTALKAKCIEAAELIDPEQDEFSGEGWEVLSALGCDPRVEASDEDAGEEEETAVEGEGADKAVEEALEDTLVEDFKSAKKLVELKELAQEWECFEKLDLDSYAGLQGPKKLRADMLDCMPDEIREQVEPKSAVQADKPAKSKKEQKAKSKKEQKAKSKKEQKEKPINASKVEGRKKKIGYNRIASVIDAIDEYKNKTFSQSDIRKLSDKLYTEKNDYAPFNNDDTKKMHPATHIVNYMLTGLVAFGVFGEKNRAYQKK